MDRWLCSSHTEITCSKFLSSFWKLDSGGCWYCIWCGHEDKYRNETEKYWSASVLFLSQQQIREWSQTWNGIWKGGWWMWNYKNLTNKFPIRTGLSYYHPLFPSYLRSWCVLEWKWKREKFTDRRADVNFHIRHIWLYASTCRTIGNRFPLGRKSSRIKMQGITKGEMTWGGTRKNMIQCYKDIM